MTDQIQAKNFTQALFLLLDETFDNVQGFYLDKGTSLFETLAEVSAEEASIPVGGRCATLAAQVKHIAFYLDVVEQTVRRGSYEKADWDQIWRTTKEVSAAEWEEIRRELRASYERIKKLVEDTESWPSEGEIGGAIGTIVHTAYHLGEIRQALCTIKNG